MASRLQRFAIPLLLALWPLAYFSDYVFPKDGTIHLVGNDFEYLYFRYKYYLLDELSRFHLPLWSPSEAAGYPFLANPFAQFFYPLNLPFAAFYRLAGGIHFADYQLYAVLGISIYALGTFYWLRSLGLTLGGSIVASLIVPVSFKMAELLRFPNAIHAAAWMPWALWAITKLLKTGRLGYGAALSGFVILLVTAGYPYFAYYSLFLFAPYCLFWLSKRVAWVAGFGILGGLVTSPYLVKMQQMLSATTDRGGKSFAYSTGYPFYFQDTLGSLVYPPASCAEGWYYFGIVGLLLILWFLITSGKWRWKLAMVGWFAVLSYITYADRSWLFRFLWDHLPGFASLRAWGRMNIILLPLIAWLLAAAWEQFAERLAERPRWTRSAVELAALVLPYLAIRQLQLHLSDGAHFHEYWNIYLIAGHPLEKSFLSSGLYAFVALAVVWLSSRFLPWRSPWAQAALAALVVVLSVRDVKPLGNFGWFGGVTRYPSARQPLHVAKKNQESFKLARTESFNSLPLSANFSVATIDNWYFDRYVGFLARTQGEADLRRRLLGVSDGRRFFFSRSVQPPTIRAFLDDAIPASWKVIHYDGNRLVLDVDSPESGFVSFIDNWDPNWRAWVDGQPTPIEPLFGTFKSVPVPAGKHRVRFAYRPFF